MKSTNVKLLPIPESAKILKVSGTGIIQVFGNLLTTSLTIPWASFESGFTKFIDYKLNQPLKQSSYGRN